MSATLARIDFESVRQRTRWAMAVSLVLHALLLAWLLTMKAVVREAPAFTEIALLEPGDLAPAPSLGAGRAAAAQPVQGLPIPRASDARFLREARTADITPEPQSLAALEDRMAARLAVLQRDDHRPARGPAVPTLAPTTWGAVGVATASGGSGSSVSLNRGGQGEGTGRPLSLHRGGGGLAPALATVPRLEASAASSPSRGGGDATARRSLAGATLIGPIADRPVLSYQRPAYPEWAKREAVEGSVTLYFLVRPDGSVKENVLVEKTAGFEDFDDNARTALLAWRFEPLRAGRTGEQWGTITFHYRLREAT